MPIFILIILFDSIEIDTIGTFNMCHAAYPALKKSKGCIINISATLQYGATWWQCHASAAKSAVDSLTRSLALVSIRVLLHYTSSM